MSKKKYKKGETPEKKEIFTEKKEDRKREKTKQNKTEKTEREKTERFFLYFLFFFRKQKYAGKVNWSD